MPVDRQVFDRNIASFMAQFQSAEHFRLEGTGQTTDHSYGVYEKDLPELRKLAVPLAQFLIEHGMLNGKIVVSATRVDVYAEEAGAAFTDANQDEIFRGPATRA